ncbi:Permease of the drug/metabolite transporter (DMT) superfamily [Rhodovulum sp. P5]|uniref:DMT family transporter n=1 Tax=Rhodovulum sp. P5 TaxID=1564506 RepID=UPI0009C2C53B|nr:EamA family transporter [Rhodovulum sp. P5]ARE40952.1 Permease of the drug/metabolite transporter (DMT) superfamily [Rhodovulum sp. P5]
MKSANLRTELPLLALLALLWGSSYLFIKVAVAEIPPVTLIALRVLGATIFLLLVMGARSERLPRDARAWRMLLVQSLLNSIGAWTVLAWGQQYVESGLASVLNSTSPIFVFLITALVTRHEALNGRKLAGAVLGFMGVALIVGVDVLRGLGDQVAGQIACLVGAALYAGAAIYGKRFGHITAVATATGTMIWASVVLAPFALFLDRPWTLAPSLTAMAATAILSILCTGVALLIYFRLVRTLGSMGVASQSYLRAGIGVILGIVFLGETFTLPVAAGLCAAIAGVALINWPAKGKTGHSLRSDE